QTDKGLALEMDGANTKVVYGDIENIKSIGLWINLDTTTEQILEGSANDKLIHASTGTLTYTDFDNAYIDNVDTNTITTGWHCVVITSTTDVDMSAVTLALNNTSYGKFQCAKVTFWSEDVSTKTRNEYYANFLASSQIGQPKRGFSLDKPKDLSDEVGLVAGYNMTLDEDGTGADLVGNALDITFSGGFLPTDNGIRFHGVDGKGVVGNVGNTKSMSFRIKLDSTTEKILEGAANDKLIHASSGTMTYPEFDNAFIDGIDSNAITAGQWTNVVIVSSTNVDMSAVTIALNNATYGDFEMADLRFYSTQLTLANAITLHNSFILPTLVETFDEGADGIAKLPREWIAGTGTYKISQVNQSDTLPTFPDGIKLYDKYLECTVAGTIATLSHQAFGTWEWDMYKLDASEVFVLFTASVVGNRTATGQDGYYLGSSNAENLILGKNTDGTPSALYVGANGIINASQWYHYKVTKIKPGVMSLLVDGVLVAASSGSNPVTDTSFSTSVFTVLDNDAGDRVANFNYKDEIEQ
ncbi:MAG: hypothetical protein HN641_13675, partial [Candidatus Marinimicrobia bacterium]|nr:hypothetical protein [Candidatus Neomarinimicrobiota bacterium]